MVSANLLPRVMLTLLFFATHSSRVMEILAMMVAAVIIFQEIFGCTRQKKNNEKTSAMSKDVAVKAKSTLPKPKKEETGPSKICDLTQRTALIPPLKSQMACATQAETLVPQPPVEKPKPPTGPVVPKEGEKLNKSAERDKRDQSAKERRMLSNPIVTPVTDEFPTEDNPEETDKPDGKSKPEAGSKSKRATKTDKAKSYVAKRNAKAAMRNVSNPIVTPVSDEFPTEEEQNGPEKRSGKPEEEKTQEQQVGKREKEKKESKCGSLTEKTQEQTVEEEKAKETHKNDDKKKPEEEAKGNEPENAKEEKGAKQKTFDEVDKKSEKHEGGRKLEDLEQKEKQTSDKGTVTER